MSSQRRSPNPIAGLLMMVLFVVLAYFFFKAIFWVLSIATPIMVIATLIINYRVYPEYLRMIIDLFKRNTFMGLAIGALTFFAFPLVAGYLLVKALLFKKINSVHENMRRREEKEFVEYEEVEDFTPRENIVIEEEPLELREIEKMKEAKGNEYDDLFNE